MTFILLTKYADCAPELELYSEMPTFDMTIPAHNLEAVSKLCSEFMHGPHPIQYDLYEGTIDGGDSRDITILPCPTCFETHPVRSMRVLGSFDPTEYYTLTCGHETMGI